MVYITHDFNMEQKQGINGAWRMIFYFVKTTLHQHLIILTVCGSVFFKTQVNSSMKLTTIQPFTCLKSVFLLDFMLSDAGRNFAYQHNFCRTLNSKCLLTN